MKTGDTIPPNTPFTLDGVTWKGLLNGKVIPGDYNSRGSALAGIEVERRRQEARQNAQRSINREYNPMRA